MKISPLSHKFLHALNANPSLLSITRGIEKESLRVNEQGAIAQTPHPTTLGSALTHPFITTDYSEALLEFITEPDHSISRTLDQLRQHHHFTAQHLNSERLWPASMPCVIRGDDSAVPVANYGSSYTGRMKTVYRLGLGHRYGRAMQTIAGVHYNFSVSDDCWQALREAESSSLSLKDYKSQGYLRLIRNFRRYFWLLLYLFGSAPALCKSFMGDRAHRLQPFGDNTNTLHAPFATSLRMGDLGYQSNAQQQLFIDYNSLDDYIATLTGAITQPHADYEAIGLKDAQGAHRQLSTSLLQIENEFYSVIRPKRTAHAGETALAALHRGGIEYIEVRCLDVNPFEPLGISREQIVFLDTFLSFCLLKSSPLTSLQEYRGLQHNQHQAVYQGRDPQVVLYDGNSLRPLRDWGQQLLDDMQPIARLLDRMKGQAEHSQTLALQTTKLVDARKTLSARVLNHMHEHSMSFYAFAMSQAQLHHKQYTALSPTLSQRYQALAEQSLLKQKTLEQSNQGGFDDFITRYYDQYNVNSEHIA